MKFQRFKQWVKEIDFERWWKFYCRMLEIEHGECFLDKPYLIHRKYYGVFKQLDLGFNLILSPRESFKSTTWSFVFPLLMITAGVRDKVDFNFYVQLSYNRDRANTFVDRVMTVIAKARFGDDKVIIEEDNKYRKVFRIGKKRFAIYMAGLMSNLRSLNFEGKRPDLFVLDDVDYDLTVKDTNARLTSVQWFKSTVVPAGTSIKGQTLYIIAGNLVHPISIVNYLLEKDGERFHKFLFTPRMEDGWIVDEWNEEWEQQKIEDLGMDTYMREYYHKFTEGDWGQYTVEEPPTGFDELIVGVDPGISEGKFVAVLMGRVGDKWYVIDVYKSNLNLVEFEEKLREWDADVIYVERNAFQQLIAEQLMKGFPVVGIRTKTNKQMRVQRVLVMMKNKSIVVAPSVSQYISEAILNYPDGDYDVLDAITIAMRHSSEIRLPRMYSYREWVI